MATLLDFSILNSLSVAFIFLAVFVGTWGLMMMVNPFKFDDSRKSVYAVFAFAIAFIIILAPAATRMIAFMIPWFAIILLIGFFMLFFAQSFSTGIDTKALIEDPRVYGFLIAAVVFVLLFAFSGAFGQELLEQQPGITDADRITGDTRPVDSFVPVDDMGSVDGYVPPGSTEPQVAPSRGSTATGDIGTNIVLTIYHPKILGTLFMFLLATITILLIGRKAGA